MTRIIIHLALFVALLSFYGCSNQETGFLETIVITPAKPKCEVNSFIQFTATGNYTDGTSEDLTQKVIWDDDSTSDNLFNSVPGLANMKRADTFVVIAKYDYTDSSDDITGYTLLKVFAAGSDTASSTCEKI